MMFRPIIKPYTGEEKCDIEGSRIEYIQQPDLIEKIREDIIQSLKPYSNREDVELIMSPIEEYHDPKNPDCLMFRLKAFVRPRKEIRRKMNNEYQEGKE